MNEETLLDLDQPGNNQDSYLVAVRWWERKRIIYNTVIILTIIGVYFYAYGTPYFIYRSSFISDSIMWLVVANIAYTVGWIGELFVRFWIRAGAFPAVIRWIFFVIGGVISIFFTYIAYSIILII